MEFELVKTDTGIAIPNASSVSIHQEGMSIKEKLGILTDAAKYVVVMNE